MDNSDKTGKREELSEGLTSRRNLLKTTGLGLTAGFAGCSSTNSGDGGGSSGDGGGSSDSITVGVLTDLSGSLAQLGDAQVTATKIARDEINNNGGINGQDIELVIRDDETTPSVAVQRAQELIRQENVDHITGALSSATTLAVRDVVTRNKVPTQSPAAGSRKLAGGKCSKYFFMHQMHNEGFAAAGAPWALENLGETMEIIYMDFAWGQDMNSFMKQYFEDMGGTVTGQVALPLDATDMSSYLSQIDTSSDIFFAAVTGSQTVPLINQSNSFGIQDEMTGFGLVNFSNYSELDGEARDGWHTMTPYPGFGIGAWDNEINSGFRSKFEDRFGSSAWSHPAMSYSQLHFFAEAARSASYTSVDQSDELVNEMEGMKSSRDFAVSSAPGKLRASDHGMYAVTPIMRGKAGGDPEIAVSVPYTDFIDSVPNRCENV